MLVVSICADDALCMNKKIEKTAKILMAVMVFGLMVFQTANVLDYYPDGGDLQLIFSSLTGDDSSPLIVASAWINVMLSAYL